MMSDPMQTDEATKEQKKQAKLEAHQRKMQLHAANRANKLKRKQANIAKNLEAQANAKKRKAAKAITSAKRREEREKQAAEKRAIKAEAKRLRDAEEAVRLAKVKKTQKKTVWVKLDAKELQPLLAQNFDQFGEIESIEAIGFQMAKFKVEFKTIKSAQRAAGSDVTLPSTLKVGPVWVDALTVHFANQWPSEHWASQAIHEATEQLFLRLGGGGCIRMVSVTNQWIRVCFQQDKQYNRVVEKFRQDPSGFVIEGLQIQELKEGKAPRSKHR